MGIRAIDVNVDAAQFHELFKTSSDVPKKLRAALKKQLKQAILSIVVPEARNRLGSGSAKRQTGLLSGIASSIRVSYATSTNSSRVGVFLTSDGRDVPPKMNKAGTVSGDPEARKALAIIFEQGQKGRGSSPVFRHPVFGDRRDWKEQHRIPYLQVSINAHTAELENAVRAALREALDSLPYEVDI